jgi:DnaK suppressor protein
MALRKEKLEFFKKELTLRRDTLAREVRQATQDMVNDDETYADSVDQASADADRAVSVHIKNREREILVQIDQALRRMEEGIFGECERCSEDISEARIKAFPFTTLCIDCKAELESEENRYPGRLN